MHLLHALWFLIAFETIVQKAIASPPRLLVIVLDGFRWDFLNPSKTPNLWRLAQSGVSAPGGIKNQFPTLTLPNLYSLVTGLTTEHHGVVGEQMYDPDLNEHFDYWNDKDPYVYEDSRESHWFSGIPIWQLNEERPTSFSACMKFPLCDARIRNKTISRFVKMTNLYSDEDIDNEDMDAEVWRRDLDTMLRWFNDKEKPINLGLMYINEPDSTLHVNDVERSIEVTNILKQIDSFVDYLQTAVQSSNLTDLLNLMFVSDHGHTNIHKDRNIINFDDYVDPKLYRWSGKSVFPAEGVTVDFLLQKFQRLKKMQPKLNVWLKKDVPDHWHYRNNSRIGPIVISEYLGYSIISHGETLIQIPDVRGGHGYSNDYRKMWPTFVATGPAFKKSFKIPPALNFRTVDLYEAMCQILDLPPPSHDSDDGQRASVTSSHRRSSECPPNDGDSRKASEILDLTSAALLKTDQQKNASASFVQKFQRHLVIAVCFMVVLLIFRAKF